MAPQTADARARHLPGIFGVITAPIGAILGAGRRIGRGPRVAHHRPRTQAASRRIPAPVAAAAVAAPAAVAATSAAASTKPEPAPDQSQPTIVGSARAEKSTVGANPEPVVPQAAAARAEVSTSASPDVMPVSTSSAVTPQPPVQAAPAVPAPQRNAALATPSDERSGRVDETPPPAKPAMSHLGVVGPLTWPTAMEDIVGYTLWPEQYSERLRTHGIGDLMSAAFVSPAALAAKARLTSTQAKAEGSGAALIVACPQAKAASVDWPAAEIERTLALTPEQRTSLGQFKTALGNAIAAVASSCRDTADLSPVERLQAAQSMLWAVHDAALLLRAPLASFYDSLSNEQKKRLSAPANAVSDQTMSRSEAMRMCGMPASSDTSTRQVERSLQITKPQRASLDALNKKTFEMGQFLMASCLKPVPQTPAERLDDAADRLTAVLFAASNVGPAVGDFYAQLSDEQKSKLKVAR